MIAKTLAKKTLTKRLALRIFVSVIGVIFALFFIIKISPSVYRQEQWNNLLYIVLAIIGFAVSYWAAFTDFDCSKTEKFFQ